jgi:hypothetical protein
MLRRWIAQDNVVYVLDVSTTNCLMYRLMYCNNFVYSLKRSQEGLGHFALSSSSHPGSHRSLPSSRRATKTRSRLFSSKQEKEELQGKGETDEDEQVQRILDAGSKRLFDSEEGRERLRENSFSNDETAKTVLNAAHEALEQPDDENASGKNGNGERRSRDHARAKVK